jgi:hypothetical protein
MKLLYVFKDARQYQSSHGVRRRRARQQPIARVHTRPARAASIGSRMTTVWLGEKTRFENKTTDVEATPLRRL